MFSDWIDRIGYRKRKREIYLKKINTGKKSLYHEPPSEKRRNG